MTRKHVVRHVVRGKTQATHVVHYITIKIKHQYEKISLMHSIKIMPVVGRCELWREKTKQHRID